MDARRRVVVAAVLSTPWSIAAATQSRFNDHSARRVVRVGPARKLTRIADAARHARDGDRIEIDSGDYVGDVAVWDRSQLTIRSVGGPSRLVAAGASAEGKAIWVVRGDAIDIANFAFTGARVRGRNGAGIRHERGRLRVSDCAFIDNEAGFLAGNDAQSELAIARCEFGHNGAGDGQSHNLYAGSIARLSVTESYFHHARVGHLLKSRAIESVIAYNRLTDEPGGSASYELEFPWGGRAYVIGNIVGQGEGTRNPIMIRYGAESYHAPSNELFIINNTLINHYEGGAIALDVRAGADRVKAFNNVFVNVQPPITNGIESAANFAVSPEELADVARFDCRLRPQSDAVGHAVPPGRAHDRSLRPAREYVHPLQSRPIDARLYSAGAIQSLMR